MCICLSIVINIIILDDMWKYLSEANLLDENDYAGRKILTETFVRQMYLMYTKVYLLLLKIILLHLYVYSIYMKMIKKN